MKALIIEREKLKHNILAIKKYADKTEKNDNGENLKIIAVVKSNGYGLGIIEYTQFLIDNGIDFFAVSTLEEALKLREAGIKQKILMLSSTSIKEDVRKLIQNNIVITIGSIQSAKVANEIGVELNKKVKVHLKIDTGFGRYGFIYNKMDELIDTLKELKNIEIEGTYSHFSIAFYKKDKYTKLQFKRFIDCIEILKKNNINTGMLHICNSSAFIKFPSMHLNAVRVGSAFLGRLAFPNSLGLKKIGYLKANISEIKMLPKGYNIGYSNTYTTKKDTKVAIIPAGYMDGINITTDRDMFRPIDKIRYIVRDIKDALKKQARYVKINNINCKILGRIGTYHVIADITNIDVNIGDEAIFQINPKYVDSGIRREYI